MLRTLIPKTSLFALILSSCILAGWSAMQPANAQVSSNPSGPSVTFQNVQVSTNPAPNNPFSVNASISVLDPAGRNVLVSITAPQGLTVTSPVVVNLGFVASGSPPVPASWNVVASAPGSYTVTLTATSTNSQSHTSDSTTYQLTFSVGSEKSLAVTSVSIPGNVSLASVFPVGITLKNTGTTPDSNVIVTLSAPTGIHVLGALSKNIASIGPGQSVFVNWTLMADSTGAFPVSFNFVSTNSGSGSFAATINIGSVASADVWATSVRLAGSDPSFSSAGPGDSNLPLTMNLTNVGTLWVSNLSARLVLDKALYWQDSERNSTQVFQVQQMAPGATVHPLYFVSIRQEARAGVNEAHLLLTFDTQQAHITKSIDIPILISPKPVLTIDTLKNLVEANKVTQIDLNVTNRGLVSIHDLKILSTSGVYTSVDTPIWIGDLGIGKSKVVPMQIYAATETSSLVPLPLTLDYQAGGQSYNSTFQVAVTIKGQPNFQIHSIRFSPSSIYAGATAARIDIDVQNSGQGIAHNLYSSLTLPSGFTPAWGNATSTYEGQVLPNSEFQMSFFVNVAPNVQAGAYPVYLNFNQDGGQSKNSFSFAVSPKAVIVLSGVDDSQLYPGASNVPLKVMVTNSGNVTAETVTAKLLGANSITGVRSSTITSVGDVVVSGNLLPGQTVPLTFYVNLDPTAGSGQQTTSVEVDWTQNQNTSSFVQTITVPYHTNSGPNYLLYYQGIPVTYIIVAAIVAIIVIAYLAARKRRSQQITTILEEKELPKQLEDHTFRGEDTSFTSPDNESLR